MAFWPPVCPSSDFRAWSHIGKSHLLTAEERPSAIDESSTRPNAIAIAAAIADGPDRRMAPSSPPSPPPPSSPPLPSPPPSPPSPPPPSPPPSRRLSERRVYGMFCSGGRRGGSVRVAWVAPAVPRGHQQAIQAAGLRQPHLEGGYYRDRVPTALLRWRSRRAKTSDFMLRAIRTRVQGQALNSVLAGTARETQTCREAKWAVGGQGWGRYIFHIVIWPLQRRLFLSSRLRKGFPLV